MRRGVAIGMLVTVAWLGLAACDHAPSNDGTRRIGGDLADIQASGELRILYPRTGSSHSLPRHGTPSDYELELAREFARAHGLEPVLVPVATLDRMIPELLAGHGDVAAANLTVTPARKARVAFTVPTDIVREQIVVRASDHGLHAVGDLAGRRVAVRATSSCRWGRCWPTRVLGRGLTSSWMRR